MCCGRKPHCPAAEPGAKERRVLRVEARDTGAIGRTFLLAMCVLFKEAGDGLCGSFFGVGRAEQALESWPSLARAWPSQIVVRIRGILVAIRFPFQGFRCFCQRAPPRHCSKHVVGGSIAVLFATHVGAISEGTRG